MIKIDSEFSSYTRNIYVLARAPRFYTQSWKEEGIHSRVSERAAGVQKLETRHNCKLIPWENVTSRKFARVIKVAVSTHIR